MRKNKPKNEYVTFCDMQEISRKNFLQNMQNDFITYLNTIEKFYSTSTKDWDEKLQPFISKYISKERLENIITLHKLCYFLYSEYDKWATDYEATFEDTSYTTTNNNEYDDEQQNIRNKTQEKKQIKLSSMPFAYDETIDFLDCLYDYITKVTRLEGLELAQSAQDVINFLSSPQNENISSELQSTNTDLIEAYINAVEETKAKSQSISEYIEAMKPIKERAKNILPELTKKCNNLKTSNEAYLTSLKQFNPQKDYKALKALFSNPKIQTLLSSCFEIYSQQNAHTENGKQSIIIAGFPGVGKTTLAKKYKNVIDLDIAQFKFLPMEDENFEESKASTKRISNPEWPQNYINAIKEARGKYDIICVGNIKINKEDYLAKNNIDYILALPSQESYDKYYSDRFNSRGNTYEFIAITNDYHKKAIKTVSLISNKIILKENETLEDVLKQRGIKLIPRDVVNDDIQGFINNNKNFKNNILYSQTILESLFMYYSNDKQLINQQKLQPILETATKLKVDFANAEQAQSNFEQLSRTSNAQSVPPSPK